MQLVGLQVLIPMFISLLLLLITTKLRVVFIIGMIITCIISIINLTFVINEQYISYYFGNWFYEIGIAYRLDFFNQSLLVYINLVMLIFIIHEGKKLESTIKPYKYKNIFYFMLMIMHVGFLGMVSTNDLFNMYVFLEISSLASYIISFFSTAQNKAKIALDYLIINSLGAAFILLGIGILLFATGHLNITAIHNALSNNNIEMIGIVFFIIGCLIKLNVFPFHIFAVKVYKYAAANLYFICVSSVVNMYLLTKFIYYVVDYQIVYVKFKLFFHILGFLGVVLSSILALRFKLLKNVIIYSIVASTSNFIFILPLISPNSLSLLLYYMITDGMTKMGLMLFLESFKDSIYIDALSKISNRIKIIAVSILVGSNAGIPITAGFFNKINFLQLIVEHNEYYLLFLFNAVSLASFIYNFKIISAIYFRQNSCVTTDNHDNQAKVNDISISTTIIIYGIIVFNISSWLFIDCIKNFSITGT